MSTVNALVAAARDGDVQRIKTLAKQCDINARDEIGWCAVHRAAVHGQVASLRCLVANGADLDAVDDGGWRAIHARPGSATAPPSTALVELGAGVETACDATGETAVHVAARNGRLKALRCLATGLGANFAARDAFGRTAAHFAAWEGHVHMLRSLKSLGTSRHDVADDGGDALFVARDATAACPWTTPTTAARATPRRGCGARGAQTPGARRRRHRRRQRRDRRRRPQKTGAEDRDAGVREDRDAAKSADAATATPAGCRRARPRRR